jgi:hypothetical protein
MNSASPGNPGTPGRPLPSRRSLLRGGTVLGLSAIAGSGPAAQAAGRPAAAAPPGTAYALTADSRTSGNMVLDYKPSQPSGWPKGPQDKSVGMTIGGHISSADFTYSGITYTISLLQAGQSADSLDPVYEATPADSIIDFRQTLDSAFSDFFTFRYLGGSADWGQLSVQSYSVFTVQPTQTSPGLIYGANLYVVHLAGGRLAEDTGTTDSAGKGIVNIFGGLKYGWQLHKQ